MRRLASLFSSLTLVAAVLAAKDVNASLYHDLEIAAQTGVGGLVIIEANAISINDEGRVAFIGDTSTSTGFEGVDSGDRRTITTNTFNQLVVSSMWTTNPALNDTATVLRETYSGSADSVFDDWSAMEFAFPSSLDSIGTTFIADRAEQSVDPRAPGPSVNDLESYYGPADKQLPMITIVMPTSGSNVGTSGQSFLVSSTVTDDTGVAGVKVSFDADGDGTIGVGEEGTATLQPSGRWEAQVGPLAGSNGTRTVTVEATDVSGAFNEATVPVMVPEPGRLLMLISGASLVALLELRRSRNLIPRR